MARSWPSCPFTDAGHHLTGTSHRHCKLPGSRYTTSTGEGEVFISGVVPVSRFIHPPPISLTPPHNPLFDAAEQRSAQRLSSPDSASDPAPRASYPDIYIQMRQTAENVAQLTGISRRDQTSGPSGHRTAPNKRSPLVTSAAKSPPSPSPITVVTTTGRAEAPQSRHLLRFNQPSGSTAP